MAKTTHLKMSFLAPAQAQKHVTVNEAFAELDALVHCAVKAMHRNDPPPSGTSDDRFLVGPAPSGAWLGEAGRLASWRNGGWAFSQPKPGWRIYSVADDTLYVLSAAQAWTPLSGGGATGGAAEIQNAARFGLGTTADATNPFTARLNSALWTARPVAEGGTGDMIVGLNKGSAARDLGHVFQSGFVTRALAGLFGSNRFRIAVSQDGASFRDGIIIDEASGIVEQPQLPRFKAYANFDTYAATDVWTRLGVNTAETNEQGAFDPITNRFTAPVDGVYLFGASLLFRMNTSGSARMRGRLALNGSTEIGGSFGEISGAHISLATALWLQTLAPLAAGDTVELQGSFRAFDGYFAANHTTFWGCKIG